MNIKISMNFIKVYLSLCWFHSLQSWRKPIFRASATVELIYFSCLFIALTAHISLRSTRPSIWICLQSVPPVHVFVYTLVRWSICLLRTSICLFLSPRLGSSSKGCLSCIPSKAHRTGKHFIRHEIRHIQSTFTTRQVVCYHILQGFPSYIKSGQTRTCEPICPTYPTVLVRMVYNTVKTSLIQTPLSRTSLNPDYKWSYIFVIHWS